jgi:transcription elongation factor S-II
MATMDAKQLQENGRQLVKAFESGEPSSNILNLLKPLEKWTATEELLRSSKIGVVVSKVRTSKDPQVASTATHLVNKWKAAVKKKPGAAGTSSPLPAKAGVSNGINGRSATSSPAPVKKEAVAAPPKKYHVAPEKRTAKEDKVNTAVTGNPARDGSIQLIYNGLCFMSEESPDDILLVSQKIEAAAYVDHKNETNGNYKQKMRSLHLNLKMKQNVALRRDVFSGAIEPSRFVKMTSDELKSEDKRKEDEAMEKENMNKAMTAVEEKAISTTYVSLPARHLLISHSPAYASATDLMLHPTLPAVAMSLRWERVGYEVFFAFSTFFPLARNLGI